LRNNNDLNFFLNEEHGMADEMDKKMMAFCGTYCSICEWKDKMNCLGCQECQSNMFWGKCDIAKCCIDRGYDHCGYCADMPCQKLSDMIADPEHGDKGKGTRIKNLRNWANGDLIYEK
jgi:hypothetical protein